MESRRGRNEQAGSAVDDLAPGRSLSGAAKRVNGVSSSRDTMLDQAIAVWQPYTARRLSREDAREIVENVLGFFQVLQEWDRAERTLSLPRATPSGADSPAVKPRARQHPRKKRR